MMILLLCFSDSPAVLLMNSTHVIPWMFTNQDISWKWWCPFFFVRTLLLMCSPKWNLQIHKAQRGLRSPFRVCLGAIWPRKWSLCFALTPSQQQKLRRWGVNPAEHQTMEIHGGQNFPLKTDVLWSRHEGFKHGVLPFDIFDKTWTPPSKMWFGRLKGPASPNPQSINAQNNEIYNEYNELMNDWKFMQLMIHFPTPFWLKVFSLRLAWTRCFDGLKTQNMLFGCLW